MHDDDEVRNKLIGSLEFLAIKKLRLLIIIIYFFRLGSGEKVYLNLRDHSYAWRTPSEYRLSSNFLSTTEIDTIVRDVNEKIDDRFKLEASLIVPIQARIRGFLVRQKLFAMLHHYYENEDKLIKIQVSSYP